MKKTGKYTLLILLCGINLLISSCEKKEKAIEDLTIRIVGGEKSKFFGFELYETDTKKDEFEVVPQGEKVLIRGNSNIALASGLNWFLKHQTNSHYSWEDRRIQDVSSWIIPDQPIKKQSSFLYSYYLNYCTYNYTMAFWDWERWEREIDWMALNGVNLPLAMLGTEKVMKNTLQRLNVPDSTITKFLPGPAFNAFWLMGNLDGWGGPVSDEYMDQQVELQKKILNRMRELGMKPVLPGFYGIVPNDMIELFPDATIKEQGYWAGGFKRPAFLSPTDSLFKKMARIYYEEQKKLFGDIEFFSGDPFHEGGKIKGINLVEAGKNIVEGMRESFPQSTWIFQGWQGNPRTELLQEIPFDNLLILDLDCDNRPQWEKRKGWEGKPWIWSTIVNFGGNEGLFGRLDVIATEPFKALNHPEYSNNLRGMGVIMEGIENNSIIYELLLDLKWQSSTEFNLSEWLTQYTSYRYGQYNANLNKALEIMRKTVYGQKLYKERSQQGTTESILCARPALEINSVSTWGTSKFYYNPNDLLEAWNLYIQEADKFEGNKAFEYDLVNLTRQVLADYSQFLFKKVVTAYEEKNDEELNRYSEAFLYLIDQQEMLLNSNEHFLLGKWLKAARDLGTNEKEKNIFEYSARVQVTTWAGQNSNLHEYAHREWAGLLSDFYKPRWEMFFEYLNQKNQGSQKMEPDYYEFESKWTKSTNKFSTTPVGHSIEICKCIFDNYYLRIQESARDAIVVN